VIHLVNHTYNQRILTAPTGPSKQSLPPFAPPYSVHPPRVVIPVNDIVIRVKTGGESTSYTAFDAVTGSKLEASRGADVIEFKLKQLKEYALIVAEPRF